MEDGLKANIEKTEENIEAYTVNDISHYILSNTDVQNATWLTGSTLCITNGALSEEEIKTMIDSIYER